jgi:hypothetical protein
VAWESFRIAVVLAVVPMVVVACKQRLTVAECETLWSTADRQIAKVIALRSWPSLRTPLISSMQRSPAWTGTCRSKCAIPWECDLERRRAEVAGTRRVPVRISHPVCARVAGSGMFQPADSALAASRRACVKNLFR